MLPEAQALERNANPLQATTISGSSNTLSQPMALIFPAVAVRLCGVDFFCNQLFASWLGSRGILVGPISQRNRTGSFAEPGSRRRYQPTTAWPPLAPP